jgi:hypothetical protein
MNRFRNFALLFITSFAPLLASAQQDLVAIQPAPPMASTVLAPAPMETAVAPKERAASPAAVRISGTWSLSDGPLTVEVLDGMNRLVLRLAASASDEDALRLPELPMPAGTYTVRVRDARGTELHRQRITYRP